MHTVRNTLVGLAIVVSSVIGAVGIAPPASALDCDDKDKGTAACQVNGGVKKVGGDTNNTSLNTFIKNLISVLFFVAGAVAVVMIILGAIRYITSNGDQANVKAAKDTILYSIIGLIVAILAYAIVQFVITKVAG